MNFSIPSVLYNYSVSAFNINQWKIGQIGSVLMVCYLQFNTSIQMILFELTTQLYDQKRYSIKDQFSL